MYGALLELQTQTQINAYNIRQLRSAADAAAQRAAAEEGMLLFSGMFSRSLARSLSRARSLRISDVARLLVLVVLVLQNLAWRSNVGAGGYGTQSEERARARTRTSEGEIYSLTVGFRY
jgi:hypothetical protein